MLIENETIRVTRRFQNISSQIILSELRLTG